MSLKRERLPSALAGDIWCGSKNRASERRVSHRVSNFSTWCRPWDGRRVQCPWWGWRRGPSDTTRRGRSIGRHSSNCCWMLSRFSNLGVQRFHRESWDRIWPRRGSKVRGLSSPGHENTRGHSRQGWDMSGLAFERGFGGGLADAARWEACAEVLAFLPPCRPKCWSRDI